MHELGHNLGLRHGGSEFANCKPNYLSVMNYSRQMPNLLATFGLPPDYSRQALVNLNEGGLNETMGIVGLPGGMTAWGINPDPPGGCPSPGLIRVYQTNGPIDWNNMNGIEANVKVDLNCVPRLRCRTPYESGLAELAATEDWC